MTMGLVKGWSVDVVDVKTTFLYGDLKEEIYMQFPEGYKSLRKAINIFMVQLKGIFNIKILRTL